MPYEKVGRNPLSDRYSVLVMVTLNGREFPYALCNDRSEALELRQQLDEYHKRKPPQPPSQTMFEPGYDEAKALLDSWYETHPAGKRWADDCTGFELREIPWADLTVWRGRK